MRILIIIAVIFSILFFKNKIHTSYPKQNIFPAVEIASATMTRLHQYLPVQGVMKAIQSVDIVAEDPGIVTKIFFKSGQFVHQGDMLFLLDHEKISAEIDEIIAKLKYLEKNFQRYQKLAQQGIIAQDNLDKLTSDLAQEKAKQHQLQIALNKKFIQAPFDGVLGIKQISVGQHIESGRILVTLARNDAMLLDVTIPENNINQVYIGQTVHLQEPNDNEGKIVAFDSQIDNATQSLTARVILNNDHHSLVAGKFVTAYLDLSQKNVLTVPATAITYDQKGSAVFVVQNNRVQLKAVDAVITHNYAIIHQGINPGDRVVSVGAEKLFDGEAINIMVKTS